MKVLVFTVLVGLAVPAAVLGSSKHNPQSEGLSIQRSNAENLMLSRKDLMQKPKHSERHTIMILEERKVTYNGEEQNKSRIKRNIELYEDSGSGDRFTTPVKSSVTPSTPEGSGDGFTTPEGSGDIPTSTVKSKPTTTIPNLPLLCQNGGFFNGKICVCAIHFFGDRCEFISGRIEVEPKINVTVNVELRFVNRNFIQCFYTTSCQEYVEFEKNVKEEINLLYNRVPGYKDVKIQHIRNGSVIVNHTVIVEVEYILSVDLKKSYETVRLNVGARLKELENNNCTSGTFPLCINGTLPNIEPVPEPSMEELCRKTIPDNYENFFTPILTHSGVICLSDCEEQSSNCKDCNNGICQILPYTGARCSCSQTDQYVYTSGNCKDKMSKSAIYGGLGAAIGVLLIILLIMGFFQFKQWRKKRDEIKDDWYSDIDDVWKNEHSTMNFKNNNNNLQEEDPYMNTYKEDNFKPALDRIDTSIEVKTKRPIISIT
ncbi:mucin-17-like [Rhinoderma darwinii]|uniref:mucin-17-like n=1 Tax=Rhinoderma darwinii TaxID=43563 RepID=UPI003F67369F